MASKEKKEKPDVTVEAINDAVNVLVNDPNYKVVNDIAPGPAGDATSILPVLTSIGIYKDPIRGYCFYKITSQGDKVLNVDVAQGDMRSTAIDNFKITAMKLFMED